MIVFVAGLLAAQFGLIVFIVLTLVGMKLIGWEPDGMD